MTAENQRKNVRIAAQALAPLAQKHQLIISHGNGPQVGLLALQAAGYKDVDAYPLDVLGAETEGMIGYMIEQELGNILPFEQPFASILTMVEVDPNDPAFDNPTKPIGPEYTEKQAKHVGRVKGWAMKRDEEKWRRVVPSPLPHRIFQIRPIKWLLEKSVIVICTGGGGIPTVYDENRKLHGAEVVIDKDFASALLAKEVQADLFIMAVDVDAVYLNWATPNEKPLGHITYLDIKDEHFREGSMKPKIAAACWFAQLTGKNAAIGSLIELEQVVKGESGTMVHPSKNDIDFVFGIPVK